MSCRLSPELSSELCLRLLNSKHISKMVAMSCRLSPELSSELCLRLLPHTGQSSLVLNLQLALLSLQLVIDLIRGCHLSLEALLLQRLLKSLLLQGLLLG